MRTDYLLAWLLPLLLGAGICRLLLADARFAGRHVALLGSGWVAGVYVAALGACLTGSMDTRQAFTIALPRLAGLAAIAWGAVLLRRRFAPVPLRTPATRDAISTLARVAWWMLLAVIVVRLLMLGAEAALRPVFPWDAWSAWAVKPKSWMLLGRADEYVPLSTWLTDPAASVRTNAAWNYPEWLAWIEVWFASAAGGWNEPLVDVAWCGAFTALAMAAYGYWRGAGLAPLVALGLTYALVSLPLLETHVALAGYADLWVGVTLGLAVFAWSRWLMFRERGQWLLGIAFAACLPALKLEGAIWLLVFAAIVALELLPGRWRLRIAALAIATLAIGLLAGGFSVPVPGLGWVRIAWGKLMIPGIPPFELAWHPVGEATLSSLFALPNWHLLWYVLPLVVIWRWRVLLRDHAARMLGLLLSAQLGLLFVLFFFTAASAWAEDFTSANRLVLQIVPCVFAFVAALLRQPPQPSSAAQ
jgi:hypothetical protein